MSVTHRYRISAEDPAAHLFEVAVTVQQPDPAGQAFSMPAWVPGSYLIRDFSRHVIAVSASANGADVGIFKTDKSSWMAEACEGPLTATFAIHANDQSVRGAHLDTTHGFFDGASVFASVAGQEDMRCELEIAPPAKGVGGDWRVATSMQPLNADQYAFGSYTAANYAELIDHPVEMGNLVIGEFDAGGIPHAIAVRGHAHFDVAKLCHDLNTLCEYEMGFLGKPKDLDRYLFLVTVRESGWGGLEHAWSSSLMCSRRDLPQRGETGISEDYRKFLGLCSHEYFHLWNVKRMKPARFTPYDLRAESYTGLLWVFEGITSYYDDLFLVRSGLITAESYLQLLARTITRLQRTRGRLRQSIEESSFDAWIKLYKPDPNSPNTVMSYYTKGALVALALDLTIRKETEGRHSLDDVMKECWRQFGESGEGMPERGLEAIARSVTGLELADFFDRFVRGTGEIPLPGLLKSIGIHLRFRQACDSKDTGGKPAPPDVTPPPWLGAALAGGAEGSRFSVVHAGGPAEKAGIAPGDEAVALDGLRLTADNLDSRLRNHRAGDRVAVTVFRDHVLMRHQVTLEAAPEDTAVLDADADAGPAVQAQRSDWLRLPASQD